MFWFCDVVLGYGAVVPMSVPAHFLLCRFAERRTGCKELDNVHIRMIQMPRETGKSTLITQGLAIQKACANPDTSILLVNENISTANAFLTSIKRQFESNEYLRALFPEVIPEDFKQTRWSEMAATLKRGTHRKEPTFFTVGVEGTVTGMHPDTIICDDMISREAMENARAGNWTIMEKVNRWVHQLMPIVNKGADFWELIVIGTRWWRGDSYEHIEEGFAYGEPRRMFSMVARLEDGSTQHVPAFRRGDIALFIRSAIENGASIFPEKWSLDDLAKLRVLDSALFACNYQNQPSDEVTSVFKSEWLRYYTQPVRESYQYKDNEGKDQYVALPDLDRLMVVDPAFSDVVKSDRSRAALVVTGTTSGGEHLILEAEAVRESTETLIQRAVSMVQRYRPRKLCCERIAQQIAFIILLRQALEKAGCPVPMEEVLPSGRMKELRIRGLEPYFQRGSIYLNRGQQALLDEYKDFPRGRHMDVLDALAYLPEFWMKPGLGWGPGQGQMQRQRVNAELAALEARMGRSVPRTLGMTMPKGEVGRLRADGSRRW